MYDTCLCAFFHLVNYIKSLSLDLAIKLNTHWNTGSVMDGSIDEWMDRSMDRWMDRWNVDDPMLTPVKKRLIKQLYSFEDSCKKCQTIHRAINMMECRTYVTTLIVMMMMWWWWLMFYGHFCAHGRLNGPSDLQR